MEEGDSEQARHNLTSRIQNGHRCIVHIYPKNTEEITSFSEKSWKRARHAASVYGDELYAGMYLFI